MVTFPQYVIPLAPKAGLTFIQAHQMQYSTKNSFSDFDDHVAMATRSIIIIIFHYNNNYLCFRRMAR